uniref:F-box protein AT5G49610-like beta-propeller domain-containing protein n=1 Tax=Arundo donax TaxID=35708 RepID=A0A0A9AAS1_ARUDO
MQWNRELKATVHVYMLQDGIWHMHTSATTQLSILILRRSIILLVGHMIYMAASLSSILVLDLASSSFFRIELPGGLTYNNGDIALSRANDSGVYVIHLKNLQLCIWLHIGVNGSVGDWLLVNTICLRDI